MPKHALTFKHFLGSRPHQQGERREKSVHELLSSSRQSAPTAPASGSSIETTWSEPSSPAVSSARDRPPHLWEDTEPVVHPAELLRREQVAQARAARSVAGPAPPRSWRSEPSKEPDRTEMEVARETDDSFIAPGLRTAASFLRAGKVTSSLQGPPTLVQSCFSVVLSTIAGRAASTDAYDAVDFAEAMLFASRELDIGLRGAMLDASALLSPRDPRRLSDAAIRVLLEHEDVSATAGPDGGVKPETVDIDWDADPPPTLSHLALTAHPAPLRLLQDIPRLRALSLTTLDLAFATLPSMDKVAHALPAGLRVLGLAGVKSGVGYTSWTRGMKVLARKLTVLHTLDISYLPILVDPVLLSLLSTEDEEGAGTSTITHLPSLRRLGMRGNAPQGADADRAGQFRHMVKDVVNRGRKWVDVVF